MPVITSGSNPADYTMRMRLRDNKLSKGWGQIATPLRLETEGGANCANLKAVSGVMALRSLTISLIL